MKRLFAALAGGAALLAAPAFSQEGNEELKQLREMVKKQSATISELMRRVDSLESERENLLQDRGATVALDRELERLQEELKAASGDQEKEAAPSWTDWVEVKGNFRFRYEVIDDDSKDYDRHRNRIRARLGVLAKPWPVLDLGFEIGTGEAVMIAGSDSEGDPRSNNQSLGNAFSLKSLWISQAYFDWHPDEEVPGLHVLGGKVARPFITPAKNELIWDSDLNPEGAVVQYAHSDGGLEIDLRGFAFWVKENKDTADAGMFGGQASFKYLLDDDSDLHVQGVVSYYDYANVRNKPPLVDGKSFGNLLNVAGNIASDFDIVEVFGEVGFKLEDLPVAVHGGWVKNTATGDEARAYQAGFTLGKAKNKNTWGFRYLWRTTENDAIYGTFADSDFGGGNTSSRGHEFNLTYMIEENWSIGASFFCNDIGIGKGEVEDDYLRYQLDMYFKF